MKDQDKQKNQKRLLEGIVVSDKMDKTVVVRVDRSVIHAKYHKRYTKSKKYKCHDAKNEYKVGDKVAMVECRPYAKSKKWRILKKLSNQKI